jgi:hypothetical protein
MADPQAVTLHFTNLCSIANSKYNVMAFNTTVEVTFRVVSDKTRAMREFSYTVAYDETKNAQYHQNLAWSGLMAATAVRAEMVTFVKTEALKPGSNEYFDPIVAGSA